MLRIKVPISPEGWDEVKQEFVDPEYAILDLEHSLVSLSKWESKWCKGFLSNKDKTDEELFDYIKCMTVTENVDPSVFDHLTKENVDSIFEYVNAPMTATYFSEEAKGKSSNEKITSELIYYWMVSFSIPFECETWHLNRLITLIRVCGIKNSPPKKMNGRDLANRNRSLNAARRSKLGTRG